MSKRKSEFNKYEKASEAGAFSGIIHMEGAACRKGSEQVETYESIRLWKDQEIKQFRHDSHALNRFHDEVMLKVLEVAKQQIELTSPPCRYTWFITGSGGRFEQSLMSDQDHGIIYETSNEQTDWYFKQLGNELADGLHLVGYPYCQGKIMSSNPLWRKSIDEWKQQLHLWLKDGGWDSIRQLQIFFDARPLYGEEVFIDELKSFFFTYIQDHPQLLERFMRNIEHIKHGIGLMGQILVERYGIYEGCVDLKYAAFLPYVNAIRLLSIKEGLFETPTLVRMAELKKVKCYAELLQHSEENFRSLFSYRLSLANAARYTDTHYLDIQTLSKQERKVLKQILKDGKQLHEHILAHIKKGVEYGI